MRPGAHTWQHTDSFTHLEEAHTSHTHNMSGNTNQGTNAKPISSGSGTGSSNAQGPQMLHPTAGGSTLTTGENPTIGGSTPMFRAATMKALPAQT